MDRSLKWRTLGLFAVTALAVLMLVPTVAPSDSLPPWYTDHFDKKIQLGLDLQGGLHIVYSIDLDKAVDDKATDIRREVEAKLADAKIRGVVTTPLRPVGAVNVVLDDAKHVSRVRQDMLAGLFEDGVLVDRECSADVKDTAKALCVRVSSDYAEGIKKSALEQAKETIEERINERGVAEPSVVTKGDQIIVELPGLDDESIGRIKDIIQRTAKLEFKMVDSGQSFMEKVYSRAFEEIERDNPGKSRADINEDHLTTKTGIGVAVDQWEHRETGKTFTDWYMTARDTQQWFSREEARKRDCLSKKESRGQLLCLVEGRVLLERYLMCRFELARPAASPEAVQVTVGERARPVARQSDHKSGWDLDASKKQLRLYGVTCDEARANLAFLKVTVAGKLLQKDKELIQVDKIDDDHAWGFELMRREGAGQEEERWRTYYLKRQVELAGSSVANAYKYWDQTTNHPEVLVEFDRWGAKRFEEMTGANVGKKMAIILDDKVSSAPVIQDRIGGGRSSITMGGANPQQIDREADDLVGVLKTGSLPAPLRPDSESKVGPLLGRDAIEKTQMSFFLAALLVVLVMLYFYRFSGIIAIVAVTLNILFMLALMAGFGATLTLPGIAALVLTIGMAVDANVVIYERIRDELRHGKSVKGAVDAGYKRGFAAVLDGHVTTGAAGYVLYQYGSGPIKGFAVMLLIGIFTDLFTQVWCARLFFDFYVGRRRQSDRISI